MKLVVILLSLALTMPTYAGGKKHIPKQPPKEETPPPVVILYDEDDNDGLKLAVAGVAAYFAWRKFHRSRIKPPVVEQEPPAQVAAPEPSTDPRVNAPTEYELERDRERERRFLCAVGKGGCVTP
jgi:hypothetical protein